MNNDLDINALHLVWLGGALFCAIVSTRPHGNVYKAIGVLSFLIGAAVIRDGCGHFEGVPALFCCFAALRAVI